MENKLEKAKKVGLGVLIVGGACVVAYGAGRILGDAIYYAARFGLKKANII